MHIMCRDAASAVHSKLSPVNSAHSVEAKFLSKQVNVNLYISRMFNNL